MIEVVVFVLLYSICCSIIEDLVCVFGVCFCCDISTDIPHRIFVGVEDGLTAEGWAGLNAFVNEYNAKKRTIVLSDATGSGKEELMAMLEVPEVGASWPNKPEISDREFPVFEWLASNEDSVENREAYMLHLRKHVEFPSNYTFVDVQSKKTLLSSDIENVERESRRIKGTTDVVITETKNVENETLRNTVEALLELKKPKNMRQKDHTPQAVCGHFAASYLNEHHSVVSVLTYLDCYWILYWFAENEDGSGVALYKLILPVLGAAHLAKYLMESLNKESRRGTLPTTFVDRLSFKAVMGRIAEDHDRNRPRRDAGGGSGGSNSQTQDRKLAGGGERQPPPSGPGGSSSGLEFQDHGAAGHGNQTMDMARGLRLFAPHSNSDVANELDLLDMVDEAEQYEIVRSFAAKYIVPYTTGQTM